MASCNVYGDTEDGSFNREENCPLDLDSKHSLHLRGESKIAKEKKAA
jgi:hypothetical protein